MDHPERTIRNLPTRNRHSARILDRFMSDLSERNFCGGWVHGLEYSLWEAAQGIGPRRRWVCRCDAERLRKLAKRVGGWIVFDLSFGPDRRPTGPFGPRFVPLNEWLETYERAQKKA